MVACVERFKRILPGLVRYHEVAAGEIRHALRFPTNHTRESFIYPARHEAGESASTSLPPMGLRVRLDDDYDTFRFSPAARVIVDALKRYAMILADNGSPWYISPSDPRFDDDVMHELDVITGRDLEVVDTSGLVNGPWGGPPSHGSRPLSLLPFLGVLGIRVGGHNGPDEANDRPIRLSRA